MEILYGVVMLLAFIVGLGIGLTIPFFIKKYVESLKKEEKPLVSQPEETKEDDIVKYLPKDLLNEWMTGEEVKANDEQ